MHLDTTSQAYGKASAAAREALAAWSTSPPQRRGATVAARIVVEQLAAALGEAAGLNSEDDDLASFLRRLSRSGHLPRDLFGKLDELREAGNRAAHEVNLQDSTSERAHRALLDVLKELPAQFAPRTHSVTVGSSVSPQVVRSSSPVALSTAQRGIVVAGRERQAAMFGFVRSIATLGVAVAALWLLFSRGPSMISAMFPPKAPELPPAPVATSLPSLVSYKVSADAGTAQVRATPASDGVLVAEIAAPAVVTGEKVIDVAGVRWIGVRLEDGQVGWIQSTLLVMAETRIDAVRIARAPEGAPLEYSPEHDFFGTSVPIAINFDFRDASPGLSSVVVALDPNTSTPNCSLQLDRVRGDATCRMGELPPGTYRADVKVNDRVVQSETFNVFAATGATSSPSFDCSVSRFWAQRMTCSDEALVQADLALASNLTGLTNLNLAEGSQKLVNRSVASWATLRENCRTADDPRDCLLSQYQQNVATIQGWMSQMEADRARQAAASDPAAAQASYRTRASVARPPVLISGTGGSAADRYPERAMRRGSQGRAVVRLSVDPYGRIGSCSVSQSSGDADLDRETCRLASRRLKFSPALNERGEAVYGEAPYAVTWRLADSGQ